MAMQKGRTARTAGVREGRTATCEGNLQDGSSASRPRLGHLGTAGGHMAMAEPVSDPGSRGHTSALAISDEG